MQAKNRKNRIMKNQRIEEWKGLGIVDETDLSEDAKASENEARLQQKPTPCLSNQAIPRPFLCSFFHSSFFLHTSLGENS
jgi:hypothetical protein